MKLHKVLTGFIFMGLPLVALADATETGKVNKVKVNSNNIISIWLDGPNDETDCSGGKQWTINPDTDQRYKEKYASILAAANTKTTITLTYISSAGCGTWFSNQISEVVVDYTL